MSNYSLANEIFIIDNYVLAYFDKTEPNWMLNPNNYVTFPLSLMIGQKKIIFGNVS